MNFILQLNILLIACVLDDVTAPKFQTPQYSLGQLLYLFIYDLSVFNLLHVVYWDMNEKRSPFQN